jgi:hypothetical protein
LPEIKTVLASVEQLSNYDTLVTLALQTAAEFRGDYIGDLKADYMLYWIEWHKQNDPLHRAERLIVFTGEAANASPHSKIGWPLINSILAWLDQGSPDLSATLKKHFGDIPTLEEARQYRKAKFGIA